MVISQVWEALGEEMTEEAWTWATGGGPPVSNEHKSQTFFLHAKFYDKKCPQP